MLRRAGVVWPHVPVLPFVERTLVPMLSCLLRWMDVAALAAVAAVVVGE